MASQPRQPTIRATLASGMKLLASAEEEKNARAASPLEVKRHRKTAHKSANDKRDETLEDMRTHLQQQANMITRAQVSSGRRLLSSFVQSVHSCLA